MRKVILSVCLATAIVAVCIVVYKIHSEISPSIPMEPEKIIVQQVREHITCFSIKYIKQGDESTKKLTQIFVSRDYNIIIDVPDGLPIYALLNRKKTPSGIISYIDGGEIHLRSANDIR